MLVNCTAVKDQVPWVEHCCYVLKKGWRQINMYRKELIVLASDTGFVQNETSWLSRGSTVAGLLF